MNALLANFTDTRTAQPSHPDFTRPSGVTETSNHTVEQGSLSQLSANDLYGMAGFLATINSEDPMVRVLANGVDLSNLGLNLNSAEYATIYLW